MIPQHGVSVTLSVTRLRCAITAEWIEVLFGLRPLSCSDSQTANKLHVAFVLFRFLL